MTKPARHCKHLAFQIGLLKVTGRKLLGTFKTTQD